MANVGSVLVENPDEILNAGHSGAGAVVQVQRDTVEAFTTPVDVTTVPIVAGVRSYTFYDSAGTSSSWYRYRYETSGGVATSDWSAAFQVGDEQAGLICSLYDARQALQQYNLSDTTQDENILEWIRQVSDFIVGLTGRKFAPDPLSGTKTIRLHTRAGLSLWIPQGIRSITTLGIAVDDQPASGGTYTTATSTDYYLDPPEFDRDRGWPATRIGLRRNASARFYDAAYGVEITGAFGWASAPGEIRAIAISLVMAVAREGGASGGDVVTVGIGGERTFERALSTKDWRTLHFYRTMAAA